jgi:hypothetical protein
LSQLGGEDYKIVDNFKLVSNWIILLISCRDKSFRQIFEVVLSSSGPFNRLESGTIEQLSLLKTAQGHMNFINDLFNIGISGLDSVLRELRAIQLNSLYVFNMKTSVLEIRYHDPTKHLSDEEVRDFQQRLGFVQYEERAKELRAVEHLAKLEYYRRKLVTMIELHRLGHPRFLNASTAISCYHQGPSLTFNGPIIN